MRIAAIHQRSSGAPRFSAGPRLDKGIRVSWIGIDLGGTKIYAVVFDGDGVLAEAKSKTPTQGGPLAVVDAMAAVVRDLGPIEDLAGVGVGAPGVIDPAAG